MSRLRSDTMTDEQLAALRARLEAVYLEMTERKDRRRGRTREEKVLAARQRARAARPPEQPMPLVQGDPDERFVRACPWHRRPVRFEVAGVFRTEIAVCPDGHPVPRWGVLDRERDEFVAGADTKRAVLGFDVERPIGQEAVS